MISDNPKVIQPIFNQLKSAFYKGKQTKDISFRKKMLQNLLKGIDQLENQFDQALQKDIGASKFTSKMISTLITKQQIKDTLSNLQNWSKNRPVDTPLIVGPGTSYLKPQPFGVVLILSAWNYPLYTALGPVAPAIAAGNCVILKPSQIAPHTSKVLVNLFEGYLDMHYYRVIQGQVQVAKSITSYPFDLIIFTGSPQKGRLVAQAAAKNLTPCILQLGGKSPTIVDHDADLNVSALRIIQGRFTNSGQTCVAPDYLLIHKKIQQQFLKILIQTVKKFYGQNPKESKDLVKIINRFHTERLKGYIQQDHKGKILIGGNTFLQQNFVQPTIIYEPIQQCKLMTEQIFGPILPIKTFQNIEQTILYINSKPKPLSLYYFGKENKDILIDNTYSGGVMINDTAFYILSPEIPFGGVGQSGYGAYHGKYGFDSCSHLKPVLQKGYMNIYPLSLRYPPIVKQNQNSLINLFEKSFINQNKLLKSIIMIFTLLLTMAIYLLW